MLMLLLTLLLFFLLRKRRTASTGSPAVIALSFLALVATGVASDVFRHCFAVGLVGVSVGVFVTGVTAAEYHAVEAVEGQAVVEAGQASAVNDTDAVVHAVAVTEHADTASVVCIGAVVDAGQSHVRHGLHTASGAASGATAGDATVLAATAVAVATAILSSQA